MTTIDLTKPMQTRDGRKVRILCTDLKGSDYPVVAAIIGKDGNEAVNHYTAEGRFFNDGEDSRADLQNVPEEKVYFLNMSFDGHERFDCGLSHSTLEGAVKLKSTNARFTLRITTIGDKVTKTEVAATH